MVSGVSIARPGRRTCQRSNPLADRFHLVAPDLQGFGQSDMPARSVFTYKFENLASVIDRFTEAIGLHRFVIYVFDYGARVGFGLTVRHPGRLTAINSRTATPMRK